MVRKLRVGPSKLLPFKAAVCARQIFFGDGIGRVQKQSPLEDWHGARGVARRRQRRAQIRERVGARGLQLSRTAKIGKRLCEVSRQPKQPSGKLLRIAIVRIRREVDSQLSAYRRKMKAEQLALVEKQYLQKRLLDEYQLPRLSLYYMS